MADSSGTKLRRLALVGSAAAALALSVSLAPGAAADPAGSAPGTSRAAAATQPVDVMTRNLYLGADLTAVIDALSSPNPQDLVTQATLTWQAVQASEPAERMAAVADEIRTQAPAVVGLQEVTVWSTYPFNPAQGSVAGGPTVVYDFLDLLLAELNQPGGPSYYEVTGATSDNFTSPPIPVLANPGDPYPTLAVQLADRDVILARGDVSATNAQHGNFTTILQPPLAPLPIARGWGSADIETAGSTFRFVNTHTEAWGPEALRQAQVLELFAAQAAIDGVSGNLPDVYVGDYNTSAPDGGAYTLLATQLHDAVRGNSARGQATCCQDPTLTNHGTELDTRIDLVLTSDGIQATRVVRTGTSPLDLPGDGDTRWASDHAGVAARLMVTR